MYEYHQASTALLDQIVEANKKVLPKAIEWMAKTIIDDRIIHTFGTGHSPMSKAVDRSVVNQTFSASSVPE